MYQYSQDNADKNLSSKYVLGSFSLKVQTIFADNTDKRKYQFTTEKKIHVHLNSFFFIGDGNKSMEKEML